ncbi:MAG: SOS response-associated peptidase [Desulfitobacteriaceae bacterium]|nr:SOS response-associated peptidase [Desulfitobacteriaceae bacterium]
MCGRYAIFNEENNIEIRKIINEIDEKFAGTPEGEEMRTGEIFPTNIAPVLLSPKERERGIQAALLKWGYPRWNSPGVIINARVETAGSKKIFRDSLAARRCVIPASGFFEWKKGDSLKKKEKYLFRLSDTSIMYMAGLYQSFQDAKTGGRYTAFVILTTAANETVSPIHDRMPVILPPGELHIWLNYEKDSTHFLLDKTPGTTPLLAKGYHG